LGILSSQSQTTLSQQQFVPHFFEPLDKTTAETLGEEKRRAAIGAGSDELQSPGTVDAFVNG
jgi:hypothetical protein